MYNETNLVTIYFEKSCFNHWSFKFSRFREREMARQATSTSIGGNSFGGSNGGNQANIYNQCEYHYAYNNSENFQIYLFNLIKFVG